MITVPFVLGAVCPYCCQRVSSPDGRVVSCPCGAVMVAGPPDAPRISGPEGVELTPVHVPYRQLALPL